jgi:hypothetical protein
MTKDGKPKRSYTVTDRVLAASRANVKIAQKAAWERRFCATRGTDAEHQASHAKLEAAQRVKREDNTYKYCSCFRHGLLVADLERSLVMAGESREEYHAHLARFEALPAVFALDAASQQVKLAHGCAFASWRRLRAFRLQSEWALRMMVHHLNEAIRWRQTGPSEGNDGLGEGQPSLGRPFDLTPERFAELGLGLRRGAESWPSVWRPIRKLNNRFDQLWCTLVREFGEPEPFLARLPITERARMRLSPIVEHFDLYSAEILGNPLLRPRVLRELLQSRAVCVKPVEEWPCSQVTYEEQDHIDAEVRRSRESLRELESKKRVTLMGNLDYHLLRQARQPPEKSPDKNAEKIKRPSLAYEPPRNFDEFVALLEAAFGDGPGFSSAAGANSPLTRSPDTLSPEPPEYERQGQGEREDAVIDPHLRECDATGAAEPLSKVVIPANSGIHKCSDGTAPRKPEPPPTLRQLAELVWDAATLPQRRAEEEARRLANYLTDYAARLASSAAEDVSRRQGVAAKILKLFREAQDEQLKSASVDRRARLALYDIAVARFGKQEEFEFLAEPRDRMDQLYSEFFQIYWAEVHRITGKEEGGQKQEVRSKKKGEGRSQKQEAQQEARSKKKGARRRRKAEVTNQKEEPEPLAPEPLVEVGRAASDF